MDDGRGGKAVPEGILIGVAQQRDESKCLDRVPAESQRKQIDVVEGFETA